MLRIPFTHLTFAAGLLLLPLAGKAQTNLPAIGGLWLTGQSLGEGAESLPVVTGENTGWGNYAFKRGVRTWIQGDNHLSPDKRAATDFDLVPLAAAAYGGLGETLANGMADHLKAGISGQRFSRADPPYFLVTYAGQGGRMIGELAWEDHATDPRTPDIKRGGGGYYQTSLDDARRAKQTATARRQEFAITALIWMQGEANGGPSGGIVPNRWQPELPAPEGQRWYRDRLIEYRKHWSADLVAITGQKGELPMFTYQTLGPAGEAQLMAADADPHIHLVGPHYMVASAVNSRTTRGRYGDAIHLSADGQRWFGEQVGKVIRRVLVEKEEWQPLRPRKAWLAESGGCIMIDFVVPRPPLVVDDKFLPLQQSLLPEGFSSLGGFRIRDANGAVSALKEIEVVSANRICLRLVTSLKTDGTYNLSYGSPFAGPLGTITAIKPGPETSGQSATDLWIEGDLPARMEPLLAEGAFYVMNLAPGAALAQAPIRLVRREPGVTVLRFENRDLRNNVPFAVGQTVQALRPFSYGNLRDSDPEPAVFKFGDSSYGTRAGQPYPLWNWCVVFSGFPVDNQP